MDDPDALPHPQTVRAVVSQTDFRFTGSAGRDTRGEQSVRFDQLGTFKFGLTIESSEGLDKMVNQMWGHIKPPFVYTLPVTPGVVYPTFNQAYQAAGVHARNEITEHGPDINVVTVDICQHTVHHPTDIVPSAADIIQAVNLMLASKYQELDGAKLDPRVRHPVLSDGEMPGENRHPYDKIRDAAADLSNLFVEQFDPKALLPKEQVATTRVDFEVTW